MTEPVKEDTYNKYIDEGSLELIYVEKSIIGEINNYNKLTDLFINSSVSEKVIISEYNTVR